MSADTPPNSTSAASTRKWVPCPSCRQPALYAPENPYRPFCGKLCRATDLGRWAQEEFRLPTSASNESVENRKPWLPKTIVTRKWSSEKLREGFKRALVWFNRLEKISRPHRLPGLTAEGVVTVVNNLSFILAALLLMAPFGFVPFSNTIPALALILLSVGMMQRDGRFILYGYLAIVATIVYFGVMIAAGTFSIQEFFQFLQ